MPAPRFSKRVLNRLYKLRRTANLESFTPGFNSKATGDAIRETTKLYRDTWVTPIIDELIAYGEGKVSNVRND